MAVPGAGPGPRPRRVAGAGRHGGVFVARGPVTVIPSESVGRPGARAGARRHDGGRPACKSQVVRRADSGTLSTECCQAARPRRPRRRGSHGAARAFAGLGRRSSCPVLDPPGRAVGAGPGRRRGAAARRRVGPVAAPVLGAANLTLKPGPVPATRTVTRTAVASLPGHRDGALRGRGGTPPGNGPRSLARLPCLVHRSLQVSERPGSGPGLIYILGRRGSG